MLRQDFPEIFAEHVLNSRRNISKFEKVAAAANPYLKLSSAESTTELKHLRKRPRGASPVLSLLDDLTLFISLYLIDMTLFEE